MPQRNPVRRLLKGSYYYEDTSVGKTRSTKCCDLCDGIIPKGSSHIGSKIFCDEFRQVNFCKSCEKTYAHELSEMRKQKYDDYD